jgi:hypothetical protein
MFAINIRPSSNNVRASSDAVVIGTRPSMTAASLSLSDAQPANTAVNNSTPVQPIDLDI